MADQKDERDEDGTGTSGGTEDARLNRDTGINTYAGAKYPDTAFETETNWPEVVEALHGKLKENLAAPRCVHPSLAGPGDLVCTGKTCSTKDGEAWSPVKLKIPYRRAEHVTHVTFFVADLDHLTVEQFGEVAQQLEGWAYVIHTTHSHQFRGADDNCLRLIMPMSRDVMPSQWRQVHRAAITMLKLPADPTCKDVSRLYYWPTATTGIDAWVEEGRGKVLDVDELLKLPVEKTIPKELLPYVYEEECTTPLDTKDFRQRLQEYRRGCAKGVLVEDHERALVASRILDGKPLAVPGCFEGLTDAPRGRAVAIHRAMSILAFVLPRGTSFSSAFEFTRRSFETMDLEPEGFHDWLSRAQDSFMAGAAARAELDRLEKVEREEKTRRFLEAFRSKRKCPRVADLLGRLPQIKAAASPSAGEDPSVQESTVEPPLVVVEPDPPWEGACDDRLDHTGDDSVINSGLNVRTILTYDPATAGFIRWNEVAKDIEVMGGLFADTPISVLSIEVKNWLTRAYGIMPRKEEVEDQILAYAIENAYDPLAEYLSGLRWDGMPRIRAFLEYFCDARLTDADGKDISDYVRTVSFRWFISAVARALDPGCKVDTVLVLEGGQSWGKTTLLEILGGLWFDNTHLDVTHNDTKLKAAASWINELAELSCLKRAENEAQKAFFSTREDHFRPPYGRRIETFKRRCVFVGTTNASVYLTDPTGNRRYWPVRCGEQLNSRLGQLRKERDQLWAEAVHYYAQFIAYKEEHKDVDENDNDNPYRWWFTPDEQKAINEHTEARMEESVLEGFREKIQTWFYTTSKENRRAQLTLPDVAEDVLKLTVDKLTRSIVTTVGLAMVAAGFVRKRVKQHGRMVMVYEATKEMLEAEVEPRRNMLQVVRNKPN